MQDISKVIACMRAGGYFDRVMAAGPELDRVKTFLRICAGEISPTAAMPMQRPDYPCFPGLRHRPWHDDGDHPAVRRLQEGFEIIREEALALERSAAIDYSRAAAPWRSWTRPWTYLRPEAAPGTWTVYLFNHMGVDVEPVLAQCPRTREILDALPGTCLGYAWGDALFSAMAGGAHLRPHCSVDNLRVRIHLGIDVPDGCEIRVGNEIRQWEQGRCLVFEDSFEHEVWNRSTRRRIVLIVDLWHPDLREAEIRALTAGFRKSEVRRIFMGDRLGMTDAPTRHLQHVADALSREDRDPLLREFWPR